MKRSTSASSWSALSAKVLDVGLVEKTLFHHSLGDEVLDFAGHGATGLVGAFANDLLEIWVNVALNPYFDFGG